MKDPKQCRLVWLKFSEEKVIGMSPLMGGLNSKLEPPGNGNWRDRWYHIIFEADTFAGKAFDVALLVVILFNLLIICLETVDVVRQRYEWWLETAEWTCTLLFTAEYVMRIACIKRPSRYITSFFGIVDLLSILPAYVKMFGPSSQSFAVIRAFRLLRVFRILKLRWLTKESDVLLRSVWDARGKVVVFLSVVVVSVTIAGTLMYEIEGRHSDLEKNTPHPSAKNVETEAGLAKTDSAQPSTESTPPKVACLECGRKIQSDAPQPLFDSIPSSIYWAIVTMTTVGYGDIVPKTVLGKFVASLLILLGYSLIIVPTGFVSAEMSKNVEGSEEDGTKEPGSRSTKSNVVRCARCPENTPVESAKFCDRCGERLPVQT